MSSKIYLGSIHSVFDKEKLRALNVKRILDVSSSQFTKLPEFEFLYFPLKSDCQQNCMEFFWTTNRFIRNVGENNAVLLLGDVSIELPVLFYMAYEMSLGNDIEETLEKTLI